MRAGGISDKNMTSLNARDQVRNLIDATKTFVETTLPLLPLLLLVVLVLYFCSSLWVLKSL